MEPSVDWSITHMSKDESCGDENVGVGVWAH